LVPYCVTWLEAHDYAVLLSKKPDHRYRLLSQAEYEYIERAGSKSPYPWRDTSDAQCEHANAADATLKAGHGGAVSNYVLCSDDESLNTFRWKSAELRYACLKLQGRADRLAGNTNFVVPVRLFLTGARHGKSTKL